MRVPRREHRSVTAVPLAGTCLAPGLTSLVLVDEAVLPGVRIPAARRDSTLTLTRAGRLCFHLADREVLAVPGTLVALAGGLRSAVTVLAGPAHHSLYTIMRGPWAQALDRELAAVGGALTHPAPPATLSQAMDDLLRLGQQRPSGWDWAVLAALSGLIAQVGAACRQGHGTLMERIGRLVDAAPQEDWHLERLATRLSLSLSVLNHRFQAEAGEGPASWIRRRRMDHARRLLALGQRPTQVAAALGYGALSQFSRAFKTTVGCWPVDYRQAR